MKMRQILPCIGLMAVAATAWPLDGQDKPAATNINSFDLSTLPPASRNDYKADAYIKAAMDLQAMGKEAAIKALRESPEDRRSSLSKGIVLCRMLFMPRGTNMFRRPRIGAPFPPGGTAMADWPLEPIEIVDGVPFLVISSYALGGHPESTSQYLQYCVANCDWNTLKFKMPTAKEKTDALGKLLASQKWKRPLTDGERQLFSRQIE